MTLEHFHNSKKLLNEINVLVTYSEHIVDDIKELEKLGYKFSNVLNIRASKNGCNSGILVVKTYPLKRLISPYTYRCRDEQDISLDFEPLQGRELVYQYRLCCHKTDVTREINFYTSKDSANSSLWIDDSKTFLKYAEIMLYTKYLI